MYYAHTKRDPRTGELLSMEEWQPLPEHLYHVARKAGEFMQLIGGSEYGQAAGTLHDIGKYSKEFQRRLRGENLSVNHAYAGALEALSEYGKAAGKIIAYAVAGHHAGLPDGAELLKIGLTELCDYAAYAREITLPELSEKTAAITPASGSLEDIGLCISFFIRFLYSCLVDSDFLDTERAMQQERFDARGGYANIKELNRRFGRRLQARFSGAPETPLNMWRRKVRSDCEAAARQSPGLFTLTVPTGGGKTLSSLAFALGHAAHNDMKRVIYAIPYTSIIEQTARQFKEMLDSDNVLEHHSSFNPPDDEHEALRQHLSAENWDAPVIVTTNVQFFESLFSNRSSRCRKLHNIANSVIILDEAQMLPKDYLLPCLRCLKELIINYKCSVVLCTATQPAIARHIAYESTEIVSDPVSLYNSLRRTQVEFIGKVTQEALAAQLKSCPQVLCIVNTRGQAASLTGLMDGEEGLYHLSTRMYPKHRARVLEKIRRALAEQAPCRVVSTQLVECGVDVDFPTVYREMAGLDSIAQAAGRCNREGRQPVGRVLVFESEKALMGEFSRAADAARATLRRFDDMLAPSALTDYFEQLYSLGGADNLDKTGIMRALAAGAVGQCFPFKTIAEHFRLIEDGNMQPVLIACTDNADLLKTLDFTVSPQGLARALQPYTVNIYLNEFRELEHAGLITYHAGGMYAVLNNPDWYSPVTGLLNPNDAPDLKILMV